MSIIKNILPPLIYESLFRWYKQRNKNKFLLWEAYDGTWQEAEKECTGYGEASILEKVKASTIQVKNGAAAYERDTVLFDEPMYNWPLISSLQYVLQHAKNLRIIDFGGALGSTYFQHRTFLNQVESMHWHIVEQTNFVDCGQENFTENNLRFEYDIASAARQGIDAILFSCVLHYLQDPFPFIEEAVRAKIPYLIIDRTPFTDADKDVMTIQYVPEKIYKAKYPCRIFSEEKFKQKLLQHYTLIWEFDNDIQIDIPCRYKGMLWQLK